MSLENPTPRNEQPPEDEGKEEISLPRPEFNVPSQEGISAAQKNAEINDEGELEKAREEIKSAMRSEQGPVVSLGRELGEMQEASKEEAIKELNEGDKENQPGESREIKRMKNIESLINPNENNSGILHEKIFKHIYGGKINEKKAIESVERHGYSPGALEAYGKERRIRMAVGESDNPELDRGLMTTKNYGNREVVVHSDLSVGLGEKVVSQARKIIGILGFPSSLFGMAKGLLGIKGRIPLGAEEDNRETISQIFSQNRERILKSQCKILKSIPKGPQRDQYKAVMEILNSEILGE